MKIYAIPGLGADKRVFANLQQYLPLCIIDWKPNEPHESVEHYARRMASEIAEDEPFILLGLSFGGVIAQEICRFLKPEKLILLSSIAHQNELQTFFKLVYKSGVLQLAPPIFYRPPVAVCQWYFGTKETAMIEALLADLDLELAKWSVLALMNWKCQPISVPIIRVHGTADRLLLYQQDAIAIQDGSHFMVIDKAEAVAIAIKKALGWK